MCKNTNQKTLKYKVFLKTKNENQEEELRTYKYKTIKEIMERHEIPRSSIYFLINNKPLKKYENINISKINEPAYKMVKVIYN